MTRYNWHAGSAFDVARLLGSLARIRYALHPYTPPPLPLLQYKLTFAVQQYLIIMRY